MIVYGFAKDYKYANDGTLQVQVRIPNIHGAYSQSEYNGKKCRQYVQDNDLPYYPSLLLPHLPNEGEVVALTSISNAANDFLVLGLTGGFHNSINTDKEDI